jgi:HSP90 family molecular chaperone
VIPDGWSVKSEAYWAVKEIQKGQAFVRLFLDKEEEDLRKRWKVRQTLSRSKTKGIKVHVMILHVKIFC